MSRFERELPFKTAYDPVEKVQSVNEDPSLTDQSQKDSTDVHKILATYDKTGVLVNVNKARPHYDDVSDVGDFQQAMNKVAAVTNVFESLPLKLRRKFGHDPKELVKFLANPDNREEAVELGLVVPPSPVYAEDDPRTQTRTETSTETSTPETPTEPAETPTE